MSFVTTFFVRRLLQKIVGGDMIDSRCMFSILERVFTHASTPQPKEVICIDFFPTISIHFHANLRH